MGQRLVIQIEDHGEPLANGYYHWSGYTGSAAELTNKVISYLEFSDKSLSNLEKAVLALYKTGARINYQEGIWMDINKPGMEKFRYAYAGAEADRNKGLLCISEKGMEENVRWEESHVDIDISDDEIYYNVLCIMDKEDYMVYASECEHYVKPEDLPVMDFAEHCEMTRKEWLMFYSRLSQLLESHIYTAISSDGTTVYEFIE